MKSTMKFCISTLLLLAVAATSQELKGGGTRNDAGSDSSADIPRPSMTTPGSQPELMKRPPALSLSPAVVMTKGSYGQSITQTLVLTNDTSREMTFDMLAQDVIVRDGQRAFVNAGELAGSIAATAVFSTPTVTVKPYATASVDVRFTIPQGSPIRAAVAIFHGTNRLMSNTGNVAMTASLGALVTFTVSDGFKLDSDPIAVGDRGDGSSVAFSQHLTNMGSEPIVPEGMVALLNPAGALVAKMPVQAQRLLPGERLEFKAESPLPLDPGQYRVLISYKFEGRTETKMADVILK